MSLQSLDTLGCIEIHRLGFVLVVLCDDHNVVIGVLLLAYSLLVTITTTALTGGAGAPRHQASLHLLSLLSLLPQDRVTHHAAGVPGGADLGLGADSVVQVLGEEPAGGMGLELGKKGIRACFCFLFFRPRQETYRE